MLILSWKTTAKCGGGGEVVGRERRKGKKKPKQVKVLPQPEIHSILSFKK